MICPKRAYNSKIISVTTVKGLTMVTNDCQSKFCAIAYIVRAIVANIAVYEGNIIFTESSEKLPKLSKLMYFKLIENLLLSL